MGTPSCSSTAGTYAPSRGLAEAPQCAAGRYSSAGSSYCAICPSGTTSEAGAAACAAATGGSVAAEPTTYRAVCEKHATTSV